MEQHQLSEGLLLDDKGNLNEVGYSTRLIKTYNRENISCSKWRIKEWDYYYIGNDKNAIALTIADNGYMDLCSLAIFDHVNNKMVEKSLMDAFSFGKLNLPRTSASGTTEYKKKGVEMFFANENGKRHIYCNWPRYQDEKTLRLDLYLTETTPHSMVIATPWKKKGHFYYNQKVNNLKANGYIKLGEDFIELGNDSYGVLDWGRGVWTYKNTWYWSSMNAIQDGHTIGWNLGYGFGNNDQATENMLFIDDKVFKLDDVRFDIPLDKKGNEMLDKPWHFRSFNADIDLIFTPKIIRKGGANALIINSNQNQVFGTFSGVFRINDGEVVEIRNLTGFAEKVYNRW